MNIMSMFGGGKRERVRSESPPEIGEIATVEAEERAADTVTEPVVPKEWSVNLVDKSASAGTVISLDGEKRVISKEVALSLSSVYACIDRISSSIGMMPIKMIRMVDGEQKEVTNHPAKGFLETSPNDWQTPFSLMRQFTVDCLNGNGYIWIKRNARTGEVYSMDWCDERAVSLENLFNGRWIYTYTDEIGNFSYIQPYDMIHVRALGNVGRKGLSLIRLHASTIRTGLDMQAYGEAFFGSGAKPSGIVGVSGTLNPAGWDKLIDTWQKNTRAAVNSKNRIMFMPADIKYTPISISPIDAALIQSMKMTREEIGAIFNVPGYMIGNLDKATYSNVTAMAVSFIKNTLLPWMCNIEQEISKKVFTREELNQGYCYKFDIDDMLLGTPSERMAYIKDAITIGIMNRNEGRVSEGKPRVDDPEMDKFSFNVSQTAFKEDSDSGGKVTEEPQSEEDKENEE